MYQHSRPAPGVWNRLYSQVSHHAGVRFTIFPSQTTELTNHTKDEKPVQEVNSHMPAFQLRGCQVGGTDVEAKANKEKTVKTRSMADILVV